MCHTIDPVDIAAGDVAEEFGVRRALDPRPRADAVVDQFIDDFEVVRPGELMTVVKLAVHTRFFFAVETDPCANDRTPGRAAFFSAVHMGKA